MMVMRSIFLLFLALICVCAVSPFKPLAAQDIDIPRLEGYLNSLDSARARFVQTTHDGTQLVGTFYLDRPGKLRFEYDDPIKDFVVADGVFIYFYDAEAGQQTNAPIGQTLADFLLRDEIRFDGDITLTEQSKKGDLITIKLVQTADPEAGSLMLAFDADPLTLKKWRVTDAQGLITEVELFYLKDDIRHPDGLFIYADPEKGKKPRYNQ